MAKTRMVDTRYWTDGFIITLDPIEKLLFMYFLTNQYTSICGVYECSLKVIAFETGLDPDIVLKIIDRFKGRIHYIKGWVYVRHFVRYQSDSPKIQTAIATAIAQIPLNIKKEIQKINDEFKEFDEGLEITDEEIKRAKEEARQKKEENEADIQAVFDAYCSKIRKSRMTDKAKDKIRVRLGQFTLQELMTAIDNFSNNTWRMQNNSHKGIAWFFGSEDQVVKWLELEVDKAVRI